MYICVINSKIFQALKQLDRFEMSYVPNPTNLSMPMAPL